MKTRRVKLAVYVDVVVDVELFNITNSAKNLIKTVLNHRTGLADPIVAVESYDTSVIDVIEPEH